MSPSLAVKGIDTWLRGHEFASRQILFIYFYIHVKFLFTVWKVQKYVSEKAI